MTGLAVLGGIHRSQVSRWLGGKQRPDHDKLRSLRDGIRLTYPELADLAGELWRSAGYGEQPPLPDIVLASWGDLKVRAFWNLDLPEAERLGHIEMYLANRARNSAAGNGDSEDAG